MTHFVLCNSRDNVHRLSYDCGSSRAVHFGPHRPVLSAVDRIPPKQGREISLKCRAVSACSGGGHPGTRCQGKAASFGKEILHGGELQVCCSLFSLTRRGSHFIPFPDSSLKTKTRGCEKQESAKDINWMKLRSGMRLSPEFSRAEEAVHGVPVEKGHRSVSASSSWWDQQGPRCLHSVAPPTDVSQRLGLASKGKAGRHRCVVLQATKCLLVFS